MIMAVLKDIVMKAFPETNTCVVDSASQKGFEFLIKQFTTARAIKLAGDDVNDFLDKIRELGLSYSFRLG